MEAEIFSIGSSGLDFVLVVVTSLIQLGAKVEFVSIQS